MTDDEKPLLLFIDTNVYLGFYRLSASDLSALMQLSGLVHDTRDIKLIVTSHLNDEFYRNRDGVIAETFNQLTTGISLPPIYSGHNSYESVKQEAKLLGQRIAAIQRDTLFDAKEGNLKADEVIKDLFANNTQAVEDDVVTQAKKRMELGNPPGKNGSIGDAINWLHLIGTVEPNTELHIISQDGDYESKLTKGRIDSFLEKEWKEKNGGKVILYQSLNSFFKANFDEIKLRDEYVKDKMVEGLRLTNTFDASRKLIKRLYAINSFSLQQTERLIKAAVENDQVYMANQYSPTIVGATL